MQHWTLGEVLEVLKRDFQHLQLITTHSMAPWAIPEMQSQEKLCRRVFRAAGRRLVSLPNPTVYESAWKSLAVDAGIPYPSTAAFATRLWAANRLSISLCEFDPTVADEIDGWLNGDEVAKHFSHQALFRGDWRASIQSPLLWQNANAECQYIEMDPMRYDATRLPPRRITQPHNMYPEDLQLLLDHLPAQPDTTVLQISSFNTQNNNMPLDKQLESMTEILKVGGFEFQCETRVGMQMASFVFSRNLHLKCANFQERFSAWLEDLA